MKSAVTICLVPEARQGPFVFHDGLEAGCHAAAELGFDAVEVFPESAAGVPADRAGDAFELLHHEGGQVFNLSIHPWLMGMAHRIKYLDEALRRVERFGNVWHATPGEVAKHYRETMMG